MIPVATIPPDPGPQTPSAPGVSPPPPAPASQPPPGSPGAQAGPGPPPQSPVGPPGATPPSPGGGAPPGGPAGAPETMDQGDPRPRLIPGSDATSGNVPASPQEQNDLRQTLIKAGQMIHKPSSRDAVLNSLHQPDMTVAQAVGKTAAQILMTVDGQKQAVTQTALSHDVLYQAARYVIPELMDIGISAGIFPIRPPPGGTASQGKGGNGQDQGPGVGNDPYNKSIRMAMLEATKVYGEAQLKSPGAAQMTEQAQNDWANQVRQEVQSGKADPRYMAMARPGGGGAGPQGAPAPGGPPQIIPSGRAAQGAPS